MCVCACVRVRACVRACVSVCVRITLTDDEPNPITFGGGAAAGAGAAGAARWARLEQGAGFSVRSLATKVWG